MAGLLVSVRSAAEARAALQGGATVIDVKEPSRGPLGRAPLESWHAVRAEVAGRALLSVALGELAEFDPRSIPDDGLEGIAYRKAGPANLGNRWAGRWEEVRRADRHPANWVAVIYADWEAARAPQPDALIDAVARTGDFRGILVDSWDKAAGCPIRDLGPWRRRLDLIRSTGRFVALAGRLDRRELDRLRCLEPDLFAVRGAVCSGGRRDGEVDAALVAELVEAAR